MHAASGYHSRLQLSSIIYIGLSLYSIIINCGAKNFRVGSLGDGNRPLGYRGKASLWGLRTKSPEAEADYRDCLHILTAEMLRIRNCGTNY